MSACRDGFPPLRLGFLLGHLQGTRGRLQLLFAAGFRVGLYLCALGRGMAEGAQDGALLLDEIRFGHGDLLEPGGRNGLIGDVCAGVPLAKMRFCCNSLLLKARF